MGRREIVVIFLVLSTASIAGATPSFELVSVNAAGRPGNDDSMFPDVSADASKVVFTSSATNLIENGEGQVFLKDLERDTITVVSRNNRRAMAEHGAVAPRISPNGRYVAFCSTSTNLVKPDRWETSHPLPDEDRFMDVFVRDLETGTLRRASSDHRGRMANGFSCYPDVANTGDVVFQSSATDLVRRKDRYDWPDVFLYDWQTRKVRLVSVSSRGEQSNGSSNTPGISADGRVVVFGSTNTNFSGEPRPNETQIWLRFLGSGRTVRLLEPETVGDAGTCHLSWSATHLSRDGRYLLFACWHRWDRPEGLQSGAAHLYRFDRVTNSYAHITPISLFEDSGGSVGEWSISTGGRYASWCTQNVYSEDDRNHNSDVFVADIRSGAMKRVVATPDHGAGVRCWTSIATDSTVVFQADQPYVSDDDNASDDVYSNRRPLP